jgi:hypothetical protein
MLATEIIFKFFSKKSKKFIVTCFLPKKTFLEHFRHKSLFNNHFSKSLGTFQKWTKKNVQNQKPNHFLKSIMSDNIYYSKKNLKPFKYI